MPENPEEGMYYYSLASEPNPAYMCNEVTKVEYDNTTGKASVYTNVWDLAYGDTEGKEGYYYSLIYNFVCTNREDGTVNYRLESILKNE